jgi:hypothetical protein
MSGERTISMPSPRSDYRIDLEKAAEAEHHAYMFKLMLALNDFLSIVYCDQTASGSSNKAERKEVHDGAVSYLIRMQHAHMYEAYLAFVKAVEPNEKKPTGQEPVYLWIANHGSLKQLFLKMQELSKSEYFERIGRFRSTFMFHYNNDQMSKATAKAVKQMIAFQHSKPAGTEDGSNLIIRTPDDKPELNRFVAGDELMHVAWQSYLFGADQDNWTKESFRAYRDYTLAAGQEFIWFAESSLLTWIREYKLQAK